MKNIISIIFISLFAASCNDAFLDRFPETSIGKENFFNTEDDLNLYINNLYSFPAGSLYDSDGYNTTDNMSNTGNTELKTMMTTTPSSSTLQSGWNWSRLRTINFFLENMVDAEIPAVSKAHFEGLGRYFRATFYMSMVKRYSDVPWYDQVIGTGDEDALFKGRDERAFVVDKIFEDFAFATANVFENQPFGAIHRDFVKMEMARAALYEGTYRKYHDELNLQSSANTYLQLAADLSAELINSGRYALHNSGNPAKDYYDLFVSSNLGGNPEIIFANVSVDQLKNSGNSETIFGNYETCPSKDLLQTYLMADGSYYTNQSDYTTKLFTEEFINRDPRLYQTFAFPGWELIRTGTYAQGGGIYVQQLNKNFSGYHQIKGFVNAREQSTINEVDYPVARYAEVLLILAESKAELGTITQADLDNSINLLRQRVNMPMMDLSPAVDPVQQNRYPQVSNPLLLEIRRERRIELALEGYRYDDLMRWAAGHLLEQEPQGIYFPSLGKYDMTGDGEPDLILIDESATIPAGSDKETNALGIPLIYYRASMPNGSGGVYLENGNSGNVQTINERGTFVAPKYYYRPIPQNQVTVNPNLNQIMGWN